MLLLLPFKAMLLSERARGRKSGSPPLFAPSFKVQRNTAHNQSSGLLPAVSRPQRARSYKGPPPLCLTKNQLGNAGSLNRLIQRVAFSRDHACTVAPSAAPKARGRGGAWRAMRWRRSAAQSGAGEYPYGIGCSYTLDD
jgi:hypothetical protein